MKIEKAIKKLKSFIEGIEGKGWTFVDYEDVEAIDTVVSHYEKSEKVDFLKSAKQPSEITHPYDLSKK